MKAIFIGSLAAGFRINAIVEDATAEDVVVAHLANGNLAEALDVQDPATVDDRAKKDESGTSFIVYGKGLGNGFTVYGPFADDDAAEEFAEQNRGDDNEWELFELTQNADQAGESDAEPCFEKGHWYIDDDGLLYIIPDDSLGLADSIGPDNDTADALNQAYSEVKFEEVDRESLAQSLNLEIVLDVLKRFDPETGYYSA